MIRNELRELSYQQLLDRGYRVCELHFDNSQFKNKLEQRLNVGQIPRLVRIPDAPDTSRIEPAQINPARIEPAEIEPTCIDVTKKHGDVENIPLRPVWRKLPTINFTIRQCIQDCYFK